MEFKSESDFEKAVEPFLQRSHITYSWQVPVHNRVIDFAGLDVEGNVTGVEFKLRNWKCALKQAKSNSNAFDFVYVCMPAGRYIIKLKACAEKLGVGLLIYDIDIGALRIELLASKNERKWQPDVEFVRNYLNDRGVGYNEKR